MKHNDIGFTFVSDDGKFRSFPSTNELCDIIKTRDDWYENELAKRTEELNRVKNEKFKDEEIMRLKEKINQLESSFSDFALNRTEMSAVESWIEKHIEEKHGGNTYAGAIGGRFSYVFVPTSLGVIGTIRCGCGEEFCFRDIF